MGTSEGAETFRFDHSLRLRASPPGGNTLSHRSGNIKAHCSSTSLSVRIILGRGYGLFGHSGVLGRFHSELPEFGSPRFLARIHGRSALNRARHSRSSLDTSTHPQGNRGRNRLQWYDSKGPSSSSWPPCFESLIHQVSQSFLSKIPFCQSFKFFLQSNAHFK